jgi:hypothetical protein
MGIGNGFPNFEIRPAPLPRFPWEMESLGHSRHQNRNAHAAAPIRTAWKMPRALGTGMLPSREARHVVVEILEALGRPQALDRPAFL